MWPAIEGGGRECRFGKDIFFIEDSSLRGGFEGSVFHRREGEISRGVLVTIFREVLGGEPEVAF